MPYEWIDPAPDAPARRLHLWPHRSLPRRGFVGFIAVTAALLSLPLVAVLGSPVLWGLLPFEALAVGCLWLALQRSYRDGEMLEELTLERDRVALVRHGPRRQHRQWEANPYWVEVCLHGARGPVPNYVTLKGAGREVEIGAFLSEDERLALYEELSRRLPAR
jgi:uncharacterized membrane protein